MTARKFIGQVHLWLGLASGLIVVIVSLTGCLYVFEKEIREWTEPYQFVEARQAPLLPPSRLRQVAEPHFNGKAAKAVMYRKAGLSATVSYFDKESYLLAFVDPYTGKLLKVKDMNRDFFRVVLQGHYYLWLPPEIGHPVVASATLVFVILLISGLVLWWPKNLNKTNREKSFFVKWKASFKRVNYDLHNVLGFYVLFIALIIAFTGLVWGFEWFAKSAYWVTSGGKSMPVVKPALSDTTLTAGTQPADQLWRRLTGGAQLQEGYISLSVPVKPKDVIRVDQNPEWGTYYKRQIRAYDQSSLADITPSSSFSETFEKAETADKIKRMNYDIHVGAILGLPGKILAFFASLICATLPVTGFYIWWGRRKKKKPATGAHRAHRPGQARPGSRPLRRPVLKDA